MIGAPEMEKGTGICTWAGVGSDVGGERTRRIKSGFRLEHLGG